MKQEAVFSLTGSECGQRAVLVQPGQSAATQIINTGCGHHPVKRLEQRLDDDAELRERLQFRKI